MAKKEELNHPLLQNATPGVQIPRKRGHFLLSAQIN